MMRQLFRPQICYVVLIILVALITLSSHPTIVDISRAAGMKSGSILSRYIILVFGALFVMCFNWKAMFRSKVVRVSWWMYIFLAIAFFFSYAIFDTKEMEGEMRSVAICLVAIMIGWQNCLNENKLRFFLLCYSVLTAFVGLMQVLINVGGFVILDQYAVDNKNSLGVMLATASFVFLMLGVDSESKKKFRFALFFLSVFTFVLLLTIRARGAMLSLLIILLYVLYERFKGRDFVFYLLFGVFVSIIIVLCLPSGAKEYVLDSFFQGREGDLTTGRTERNVMAWNIWVAHPFLGNLIVGENVEWVHNFPLLKLQNYGLLFGLPILLIYFYLLVHSVKMTIKTSNKVVYNLGYYILLIPFIVSMSEPTFPFGPGTATVFNFIVFGIALRNTKDVPNGV